MTGACLLPDLPGPLPMPIRWAEGPGSIDAFPDSNSSPSGPAGHPAAGRLRPERPAVPAARKRRPHRPRMQPPGPVHSPAPARRTTGRPSRHRSTAWTAVLRPRCWSSSRPVVRAARIPATRTPVIPAGTAPAPAAPTPATPRSKLAFACCTAARNHPAPAAFRHTGYPFLALPARPGFPDPGCCQPSSYCPFCGQSFP